MGILSPLPDAATSISTALTFDLSVASAANPTELNAIGTVAGDLRLVHPTTATSDSATWYRLDASTDSVSAPYIMASATAGLLWIAIAGTYEQGARSVSGAIVSTSTITGTQLVSNIAIGTAPLVVTSSTVVANLNVSQLLGQTWAIPGSIGATTPAAGAFTTISASGQITSTLAGGTAPFVVTSTTVVGNLNVSQLLGGTWAAPGTIGSTTPSTGAFTTISATGQITSTLAGGTAPFVVTSTTVVPNLNAGLLNGLTWTAPGAIGGTTPATTFALSGILTSTNTTSATTSLLGAVVVGNGTAATSVAFGAGNAQIGTALTVGANATFGNNAAGNTAINVNAATGNSAYFVFKVNNVNYAVFGGSATNPIYASDQIAATPWTNLTYTSGLVSTGYWTFPGTLAATSSTAASVKFSGGVAINAGLWISSATMISTSTSFTNGAGSSAGTLTNAPAIGNPTKWIPINDNGTTRYIPAW